MLARTTFITLLAAAGCADDGHPNLDATIELHDGDHVETWAAGAMVAHGVPDAVSIYLGDFNDGCGWRSERSISISLPVDRELGPHVVGPLRLEERRAGGSFDFEDREEARHLAVSGTVLPTRTVWTQGEIEGRFDRIVGLDGTFDVQLEDGRRLTGDFVALACAEP